MFKYKESTRYCVFIARAVAFAAPCSAVGTHCACRPFTGGGAEAELWGALLEVLEGETDLLRQPRSRFPFYSLPGNHIEKEDEFPMLM